MDEIERDWAESVEMNCISDDGQMGFEVRLARYPARGQAWLWVFVLLPDAIYGYNDDTLPLTGREGVTEIEAEMVTYALPGDPSASLDRYGSRSAMREGRLRAQARAHRADHPAIGTGDAPVHVEALFRPGHAPVTRRRGRMEVLGMVEATIETPEERVQLTGRGHWHEQHGVRPRFASPFTYLTLRGERLGFVGTKTPGGAGGFAVRDGDASLIRAIEIDPPSERRAFKLVLEDGSAIDGTAITAHSFSIGIEGQRRPGTAIVAESALGTLSGMINDWQPAGEYARPRSTP